MDIDKFVLDTNFILDYLQGVSAFIRFLAEKSGAELWISDIARLELLSFPPLDDIEEKRILDFLGHVDILPITDTIGDTAITFRKTARKKLPDSIIAATAIYLGTVLVASDKDLLASSFQGLSIIHP